MDYEKKYNDALERAKSIYNADKITGLEVRTCEQIFPELRESEDEGIRKEIISFLKEGKPYHCPNSVRRQEWLSWLEKQGGKVDVLNDFTTEFERQTSRLIASSINKEWDYTEGFVKYAANALLQYAKNELEKQGEQKSAWSEEDEKRLESIIEECSFHKGRYKHEIEESAYYTLCEKNISWLKSLKPQPRWKPTEGQLEALKYFISFHKPQANAAVEEWKEFKNLESLYNDLKSL